MSEISKYEAYKKKLQGLCDEHDMVYRLRKDKYPFTLTIRPAGGLDAQMTLLEREEEGRFTSPDASITFVMKDGIMTYRLSKTFTIDDTLFGKFKNLFKNLYATWTAFFFQDVMERDLLHGRSMPVIDEGEADDDDDIDDEDIDDEEDAEDEPGEDDEDDAAGADDGDPIPATEEEIATATSIVRQVNKASISMLQRQMKIGYAKAAGLLDILEERGVVGPFEGGKPRKVLPYDQPDDATEEITDEEGDSDADEA